jgi:hypothetical protein
MQKLALIILTLLITNISYGQKNENEIFEASKGKWKIPIKKYSSIFDNEEMNHYPAYQFDSTLRIFTDSAYELKALHKGKVILVSEIDSNSFILMVKFGNYFLTYASIEEVFVEKDEEINENQLIGRVGKNLDGIYELNIYLAKKEKELCAKNWIHWNPIKLNLSTL